MSKTTVTAEHYVDGIVSRANPKHIIIQEAMIKFAKIKCREMQEAILEKAMVLNECNNTVNNISHSNTTSHREVLHIAMLYNDEVAYQNISIDKQSILQAYDIEGIK